MKLHEYLRMCTGIVYFLFACEERFVTVNNNVRRHCNPLILALLNCHLKLQLSVPFSNFYTHHNIVSPIFSVSLTELDCPARNCQGSCFLRQWSCKTSVRGWSGPEPSRAASSTLWDTFSPCIALGKSSL